MLAGAAREVDDQLNGAGAGANQRPVGNPTGRWFGGTMQYQAKRLRRITASQPRASSDIVAGNIRIPGTVSQPNP